jgi:electron transfer flavoprotein beta subunit
LAEHLDFAQVCSVSYLELSQGQDVLTVHRRLDHGDREVVACKLPAVITVDEGAADAPYASLPKVLAAERAEIRVFDLAGVGLKLSDVKHNSSGRFLNYTPPRPRTKKSPALDTSLSPMQMMQQISGGGGPKKSSGPVEGEPQKVAAAIVRFLITNGILLRESEEGAH